MIELIITTVGQLISILQQVSDPSILCLFDRQIDPYILLFLLAFLSKSNLPLLFDKMVLNSSKKKIVLNSNVMSSFKVNEDVLWSEFLILLRQLGGSSAAGCEYVDKTLKTSALLNLSFHLRRSDVGRDSANDLLSFFLARCLHQPGNLLVGGPLTTLASLVALIPTSTAELADWIGPDRRAPFGAKCSAIVLLYQLELGCSSAATSKSVLASSYTA